MKQITIYTDGSACAKKKKGKSACDCGECPNCRRLGGFGVYFKEDHKAFAKGYENTKTGRMELTAFLVALRNLPKESCEVTIWSDSMYIVNTIQKGWLKSWALYNFRGVKNVDLLSEIQKEILLRPKMKLKLKHVKGHQDPNANEQAFYNNLVDKLASYKRYKEYTWDENGLAYED